MARYKIIAATGCPTGIAHTYMAQEALEEAAKKIGISIKVETHGQSGVENAFSKQEIDEAYGVIIAADKDVDIDRFDGKRLINVSVTKGMKEPDILLDKILNDKDVSIYHAKNKINFDEKSTNGSFWHNIYVYLMNGVSHMLPLVVAGGVLTAISFFWGINSADPKSSQFNEFAHLLNTIGGFSMNLMVPVLCAYIAEAIAKRPGLIAGFAAGMIAYTNGTGFLGGIFGGFLAGYIILILEKLFKEIPKSLNGFKAIFLLPVFGVFISGAILWYCSVPMKSINIGMMNFLKGMQNSSPILLGLVVGIMCASDMGGPINKAAYLTGTALLAQGNYFFMAGVSAACIAPPLATGFAVLFNKNAFSENERNAGYINFLLGSTHITEGAIPFAAKNPLINIPAFMVGSVIAATLSYLTRISVPAPHGGFIVLPMVNKPFLWILWILIGAVVSGFLISMSSNRQANKNKMMNNKNNIETNDKLNSILKKENIYFDVEFDNKNEVLKFLSNQSELKKISINADSVFNGYIKREAEGSTGMENGIAIPHSQSTDIKKPAMIILKLKKSINDWETFDNEPVDTIISFLIPEGNNTQHLKYLSDTSKLLMHKSFVKDFKKAKTVDEVYNMFV